MDEFEKYFKRASELTTQNTHRPVRKGSLPHEPSKKSKKPTDDFRKSDSSKRSRSIHHSHQHNQPPICIISPADDDATASNIDSFFQQLSHKRNSKDGQQDSLGASLLKRQVRRHSINPEEITASKLQQIDQMQKDDCLVVRSFLTSPKGLVDKGDSFKRRASNIGDRLPSPSQMLELSSSFKRRLSDASKSHRSSFHGSPNAATIADLITANASTTSENNHAICLDPIDRRPHKSSNRASIEGIKSSSLDSSHQCSPELEVPTPLKKPVVARSLSRELANVVIVLGDYRVGKSSLITQFLSSEHLMGFDNYSESSFENIISIYVDGVETQLNFIEVDFKTCKTLDEIPRKADCKAFLVVYSITDSASFETAVSLVETLCLIGETSKKGQVVLGERPYAVVLVANKGDLVRNRKVYETEAKEVCLQNECKYIEVSSALSHNVNELLVGLVQQIKLNDKRTTHEVKLRKNASGRFSTCSSSSNLLPSHSSSFNSYFKWFKKLFAFKHKDNSFDCHNMHTL